jgi:hypothetical protein
MISVACEIPFEGAGDCNMLSKRKGAADTVAAHAAVIDPPRYHGQQSRRLGGYYVYGYMGLSRAVALPCRLGQDSMAALMISPPIRVVDFR